MIVMAKMIGLVCTLSVFLFQIAIGIWLLIKDVNVEQRDARASEYA